mgnify:CR=1 FL=1
MFYFLFDGARSVYAVDVDGDGDIDVVSAEGAGVSPPAWAPIRSGLFLLKFHLSILSFIRH